MSGAHRSASDRAGGPADLSQSSLSQPKALIPCAFAFGDETWPGLAKLLEESGEVAQVVGKLMMTHGDPAHWSGNLRTMLLDEVADLEAAIVFLCRHNLTPLERQAMARRVTEKVSKFEAWHADMAADPPPSLESVT